MLPSPLPAHGCRAELPVLPSAGITRPLPLEAEMKLAKPRIDIGFATNDAPAALAFWQNQIGLPFEYTQPIRRGYKQHRHDLCGSIPKINRVYEKLPDNPPSGYLDLLIARDGIAAPQPMADPD